MWNERNILMMGEANANLLSDKRVLIIGVGGVGAYTAESLVRAGIGHIVIVDADEVSESNINRQIIALHSTIGRPKVEVLAERLKDINPLLDVTTIKEYMRDERTEEVLSMFHYDYIVDAIDTLAPKVFLLYSAVQRSIPVVSSMGSGGKWDPSRIRIDDIDKSNYCKLARMVRKRLHHLGVRTGIKVVYSDEVVDHSVVIETEGEANKHSNVGTISYMPPLFGCMIASVVIRDLVKV